MTIQHTPHPVRTDVRPAAAPPARPYRRHGLALTTGALAWAASIAAVGLDYSAGAPQVVFAVGSGLFQVGLLCLLRVLARSRALGTGRLAAAVVRIETVLVCLALTATITDGLGLYDDDVLAWVLLDAFWPISMLGMCAIGVRIAIAGRWQGPTRYWPLVAESWAVVVIPTVGVLGQDVGRWVAVGHLCVGYAVLGWLVSRERD